MTFLLYGLCTLCIRFSYSCAYVCVSIIFALFLTTLAVSWITPAVANDLCVFSWIPILLTMNCVNCGIATNRSNAIGSVLLEDPAVLSIIRGWTGLQTVSICK